MHEPIAVFDSFEWMRMQRPVDPLFYVTAHTVPFSSMTANQTRVCLPECRASSAAAAR
jgi:hypothetical protein